MGFNEKRNDQWGQEDWRYFLLFDFGKIYFTRMEILCPPDFIL